MKFLNITLAALDAAITAPHDQVVATRCVIAQAAMKDLSGEKVLDCGSFYVETDKTHVEVDGGFRGTHALKLANIIELFREGKYSELKTRLPLTVPVTSRAR